MLQYYIITHLVTGGSCNSSTRMTVPVHSSSVGPVQPEGLVGGQPQRWWREGVACMMHQVACHPPARFKQVHITRK